MVGTWLRAEVTGAFMSLRYEPEGAAVHSQSFKSWRQLQIGMPLALVSVSSLLLAARHQPSSTQARRVCPSSRQAGGYVSHARLPLSRGDKGSTVSIREHS